MDVPIEVTLDIEATDIEVTAAAAAFAEAGFPAEVTANFERRSIEDLPWVVMITVPTTAFFTAMASEAGKNAWKVLKRLGGRIHEARKASSAPSGTLTLVDQTTGNWIALPPDLEESVE